MAEINDLNVTDASNTARFPESQAPSSVNDGGRALEGILARAFKDTIATSLTSGGTANAQTVSANRTISAYYAGLTITFKAGATNTGSCTLNVDSVSADTIKKPNGQALAAGDIVSGGYYTVVHDGTSTWYLLSGVPPSRVLLDTQTASASATLDFTTGIDSTFDRYELEFTEFIPATDGQNVWLRVSDDGGSTFKAGSSDYAWTLFANARSAAAATFDDAGSQFSSAALVPATALSNNTGRPLFGTIEFASPSTSKLTMFKGEMTKFDGTALVYFGFSGFYKTGAAINALRVMMSSGNITSGTVRLYGIRK